MQPIRNRIYCPQCGKQKIQFSSAREADLYIARNAQEISERSGYAPVRSYFCEKCQCWHTTSRILESHCAQKNDHHLACYERSLAKIVNAAVRLAVKEIKGKIHELNRYVFGHSGDGADEMPHYKAVYQEICKVLEEIRDSLSPAQLRRIMRRLKIVEQRMA